MLALALNQRSVVMLATILTGKIAASDEFEIEGKPASHPTTPSSSNGGSTGGLIEGNVFDGWTLSGADSWVDVKGSRYVIRGNTCTNSPTDGFQTHVIDYLD